VNILITGPESTGKTTLTNALSLHFNAHVIPEYARSFLEARNGNYHYDDLKEIAEGHLRYVQNTTKSPIIIFDTFLLNLKIWSIQKFGKCDSFIESNLWAVKFDKILLMYPDIAWTFDPLRESQYDRLAIFNEFKKEMDTKDLQYSIIKGEGVNRLNSSLEEIGVI
jgi:NadR type nicotinamide-nucleotide adenylyltransferase